MPRGKHRGGGGGRGGGGRGGGGGGGGRGGGGGGGRGGGRGGGSAGGNRQGKILYNSGDEPAFIRNFKARTGYQAPLTTDDKHRMHNNEGDERPRDGDYRKDDERPQIVQLNPEDLTKEEVETELLKAKEVEEEKQCVDSSGRLLFRRPKEKSEETDDVVPTKKSDIVEMASNKATKRKTPSSNVKETEHDTSSKEPKKTKTQLLSFMDESGIDGDD